jgi:hypothetical protein
MDILEQVVIENKTAEIIERLLTKTSHSIEEIADLAGVSVDFVKNVKKDLRKRKK